MAVHSHNISPKKTMNIPIVGNYLPLYHFLTALNTQRVLWSSNIAKALTRHDPCAASEPGNRTRSPQWLASRGRGLYEPIREDLAEILISTGKNDQKWDYNPQNETYQQAVELSGRIVPQKDWSSSWQIYMVLLLFAICLCWNIMKHIEIPQAAKL